MNNCFSNENYFSFGVSGRMEGFQLDSDSLKFWFQLWVVLTVQEVHFSLQ